MNYIIYTPSGARVKEVMEERVTGKGRGIRMVKIQ